MNLPLLDSSILDTDRLTAERQSVPPSRLHAVTNDALPAASLDQIWPRLFGQRFEESKWISKVSGSLRVMLPVVVVVY